MRRDYTQILKFLAVVWLIIGLVVLTVALLVQLFDILIVFVVAALIAAAFAPRVRWLERRLPKRTPRIISVLIVYLVGLGVIIGVISVLAFPLIQQTQQLAEQLPELGKKAPGYFTQIEKALKGFGISIDTSNIIDRLIEQVQGAGEVILLGLGAGLAAIVSAVGEIVIATVVSIYMLLSAAQFKTRLLESVPENHKEDAGALLKRMSEITTSFIRGQVLLALSIGIPVGLFTWFMGLPYSALLGLFSGLAEFIPVVGSLLGAIPAILVGFVIGGPTTALILIVFFIIINQLESNVIQPRLVGGELGLHPITAIFALAVGLKYFGFWGALLAAPAAAIIWALFTAVYRAWPKIMGFQDETGEPKKPARARKPRAQGKPRTEEA